LRRAPLPKTIAVRTIAITEGTLEARMTKTKPWAAVVESRRKTSGLSMIQARAYAETKNAMSGCRFTTLDRPDIMPKISFQRVL
jgi:hypothetical protein